MKDGDFLVRYMIDSFPDGNQLQSIRVRKWMGKDATINS